MSSSKASMNSEDFVLIKIHQKKWQESLNAIKSLIKFAKEEKAQTIQEDIASVKRNILLVHENIFLQKEKHQTKNKSAIDWDEKINRLTNEEFDNIINEINVSVLFIYYFAFVCVFSFVYLYYNSLIFSLFAICMFKI